MSLDLWTLGTWTVDAWTLRPWSNGCVDSGCLDPGVFLDSGSESSESTRLVVQSSNI